MANSFTMLGGGPQYRAAEVAALGAYVPDWLISRALVDPAVLRPAAGGRLHAAIAFADIAGFTPLAERLAATGREGAEELTALLNRVYTALIEAATRYGGGVVHFGGDAMTVLFPAGGTPPGPRRPDRPGDALWALAPAILRALRGARAMQEAFDAFRTIQTGAGAVRLTMEVGISAGQVMAGVVGRPEIGLEFVLAGRPVDRAGLVEHHAPPNAVHLDAELVPLVSRQVTLGSSTAGGRAVLDVAPSPPRRAPSAHRLVPTAVALADDESDTLIEALLPFVPPAVGGAPEAAGGWAPAGEHRHITTAFIAFSGLDYDADPYPLHKLHAYFCLVQEAVAPFGGRVNRVLMGDKGSVLHLLFGAPVAHEDDAARALRAMLHLGQAGEWPFPGAQRIGIATGPVFAGALGAKTRREYTVLGTTVNRASRLMEAAAPGQVLLDAATAERAPATLRLAPLPPQDLRGLGEPIPVWRLEGEDAPEDDAVLRLFAGRGDRVRLVGRAAELAQAEAILEAARAGNGQVLLLTGEAGMGKSRLAEEVLSRWLLSGGVAYAGTAQAYGAGRLYQPWVEILGDLCDLRPGLPPAEQQARLADRVAELAPALAADLPLLAQFLGLAAPDLRGVPSGPWLLPPGREGASAGPEAEQRRRDALIREMLRTAAARRPVLLLLNGLQWADPASLALLDRVAEDTADLPLLVCLEARPGVTYELAALARPNAHTITLDELPPAERRELLAELAAQRSRPPDPALVELIGERSQGNPFFIEELFAALERGEWAAGAPAWPPHEEAGDRPGPASTRAQPDAPRPPPPAVERIAERRATGPLPPEPLPVRIPETIEGVVMARLDSLDEQARQVVRHAAVLGATVSRPALRSLVHAALADTALDRALATLVEADLLRPDDEGDPPGYRFRHNLTRQVAYESLPYAERRRLHARAGLALEALHGAAAPEHHATLAYHFGLSELHPQGRAYLEKAGDWAAGLFALPEATRYYQQALAPGRWPERGADAAPADPELLLRQVALHRKLGRAQVRTGDYAGAEASLHQALALCPAPAWEESVAIGCEIAWMYEIQGNYHAALQACQAAEAELVQHPPTGLWGRLRARLAGVLFRRGNYSEALVALNAALPLLIAEGAANELAAAYNLLGNVSLMRGDMDDARLQYERALDLYQGHDDLWGMAVCYNNLGNVCWCIGQLIAARDYYEQSLALREQMGDPGGAATVYTGLASTFWQMGELAEAHRCADLAIRLAEQVGRVESTVLAHIEQANLLETEGDWPGALARLEQAHALAQAAGSTFLAGRTGLGQAQVHLRRGDLAAAQAGLVTWGPQMGAYAELVQIWLLISAEVALATGQPGTALGLLTQVAAAAEQYQAQFVWCRTERLLGELALQRHDPATAVAHARQARARAERMPAWIELAQALDLLARCYEAAPDQPGALPPAALLAQAVSILEECGPTRFLAPLQTRLAALNG